MKTVCRNCCHLIGKTVHDKEVSLGEEGKYSVFYCKLSGREILEPWRETCPSYEKRSVKHERV